MFHSFKSTTLAALSLLSLAASTSSARAQGFDLSAANDYAMTGLERQLPQKGIDGLPRVTKDGYPINDFVNKAYATNEIVNNTINNLMPPANNASFEIVPYGELPQSRMSMLAPASVDNTPIPSGSFHFGFPKGKEAEYRGVTAARALASGSLPGSFGGSLPPVATSSVDFNICDMPFTRDRGSAGIPMPVYVPVIPPSGGGGGGTGGGGGGTTPGGGGGGGTAPGGGGGGTMPGSLYVSGAPAYRYTSDGGYMTGSGIIAYPNGRKERGGPMFMYKSGFGFKDMLRPNMAWTWSREEVYSYYR